MPDVRLEPRRRTARLVGDALVAAWVLGWAMVAWVLKRAVDGLAEPLSRVGDNTEALARRLDDAARDLGSLPLVGEDLSNAFGSLGRQLADLTTQADAQADSVLATAWLLFWVVWLLPSLTVVLLYLPRRLRRARELEAARRYLAERGDFDLFALRALQHASPTELARLPQPPAEAWRSGDPATIRALAQLELDRIGLAVGTRPRVEE